MKNNLLRKALKETTPVFFGYIAIGIAFGLMVVAAGYPWWISLLMGITMFTGAGQYFGIAMFASGATLPEILLVQFLLSIRHIFYGLALIGKYKNLGKYKYYLIYAITDETFALISANDISKEENPGLYYTLISALNQFYWLLGGVIGAFAYNILEHLNLSQYLQGVDFALTALFTVLLIEKLKEKENLPSAITGILVSIFIIILYWLGIVQTSSILWISICAGLGIMLLIKGPSFFNSKKENLK